MQLEIKLVRVYRHGFGMDTVSVQTQLPDPCSPDDKLTLTFKAPKHRGYGIAVEIFGKKDVTYELYDASSQRIASSHY